jgi:hypothetical protein
MTDYSKTLEYLHILLYNKYLTPDFGDLYSNEKEVRAIGFSIFVAY